MNTEVIGLLDSGAQCSVAGDDFDKIMSNLGIGPKQSTIIIKTADGTAHGNNVHYEVPIKYAETCCTMNIVFSPAIPNRLILGMDFWNAFRIQPVIVGTIQCEKSVPLSENHELEENQAQRLQKILAKMPFSTDGKLSRTHLITHSIDTKSAAPIKQRHYIVSPYIQKEIDAEIDRLLKLDVIEPCEPGAWSSPMVVVKKATGKVRLCLDARRLNDVTVKDAYPQQQINRILGRLAGTKVLSSIDFSDAFLQVPLEKESQIKTAFAISGRGFFKFKRMAFGLCNSGATLCRLVDRVIGCDLEPYVFVYLDDIIVATESFEKHFEILEKLSGRISMAGLTISVTKSRFCMKSLKYLGYVISEKGISPDPDKISAITEYVVPKTVKDVRRLIGLAGWYRRFIQHFATITAPITALLKKNIKKLEWTPEADEAFAKIKVALTSAPILANPDYDKPFIIQSDASDMGMGAILVQGEGEDEKVIAYFSQKLSSAQRKYQTTERECLAVILAVEKFRPYIEGARFTVITDHASLLWLRNLKDPAGRLGRWALRLQPYDFELKHRKGRFMTVADALSRAVETVDVEIVSEDPWYEKLSTGVKENPEKFPHFKFIEQNLYKRCAKIRSRGRGSTDWREVVRKCDRQMVLRRNHDHPLSAHGGYFKTADRVKRHYYWPNMDADIRQYVQKCETCKACKPTNVIQRSPMGTFREPTRPFEIVYVDFVGPLPRSKAGHAYMFVVVDSFTKFVHIQPMRQATAQAAVKCLRDHIFLLFGTPKFLVSDNGPQFISSTFKTFLESFNVTTWYTSRYHPQANATEAANKTVETAIRSYLKDDANHKNWDAHLTEIACAMNTARHTSTMLSPFEALFGRHMCNSGKDYTRETNDDDAPATHNETMANIRKIVSSNLRKNYEQNKRRYDLRTRPITYNIGEKLWVKTRVLSDAAKAIAGKLMPGYRQCIISKKTGTNSYEAIGMDGKKIGVFNTDSFKK